VVDGTSRNCPIWGSLSRRMGFGVCDGAHRSFVIIAEVKGPALRSGYTFSASGSQGADGISPIGTPARPGSRLRSSNPTPMAK
jgi:hypothetical protein